MDEPGYACQGSMEIWTQSNSLMAKILKYKYFKRGDILIARKGRKSSYLWQSLLWGRAFIDKGVGWTIGQGKLVKCLDDNWLPELTHFKPYVNRSNEFP